MSNTAEKAPMGAPSAINHRRRSHLLELSWPDGTHIRLDARGLRAQCLCSTCRAMKIQGWDLPGPEVVLERVEPFGVAGLQLVFSDGHDRGVFPWHYLLELDAVIGRELE